MQYVIKHNKVISILQIIVFVFFIPLHIEAMSVETSILFNAETEEEILEWAIKRHGYASKYHFDYEGKKILVVLGSSGFGIITKVIYVYRYFPPSATWDLLLLRITNTSDVSVRIDREKGNMVFTSKAGKTLLIQPLESLNIEADLAEQ